MREVGQVHLFSVLGDRLALDIASGAVHRLDEVSWNVLKAMEHAGVKPHAGVDAELGGSGVTGIGSSDWDTSGIGSSDSGTAGAGLGDSGAALRDALAPVRAAYGDSQVNDALAEIKSLIAQNLLYSPIPDYPAASGHSTVVKSLCMNVAHDCNLRCSYCFASTGSYRGARSMMTADVARAAVDFLIERSGERATCEMDFFGGEPCMNMPVVYETVRYARQREAETGKTFRFTLTTNATLLTPEIARFVNDNDMQVILSMDGRETSHDRFRVYPNGRGSHAEVMARAKQFLASRDYKNYYARGTYTRHNLDFTADARFFLDNGINAFSLEPAVVDESLDFSIRPGDLPQIYEEYDKLVALYLDHWHAGKPFTFYHFEVDLSGGPCLHKRMSGCGAGREYFAIAPDGGVYPCHQFDGDESFCAGNVLGSIDTRAAEARFTQAGLQFKQSCADCWARFFCGGGCHSSAWAKNRNLLAPDKIACEIQKKRLECGIYASAVKAAE